jgi:hypothetical protein
MIPHHSHLQTPPSEEEDPLDALDRVKEILADGDHPFPVDRKTLKEVMRNKMGQEVVRIKFISSGMFGIVAPTQQGNADVAYYRNVSQSICPFIHREFLIAR